MGWKWSVAAERHGVPIGWAIDGANRNDVRMLEPTIDAIERPGSSTTSHVAPRPRLRLRCRAPTSPPLWITEFDIQLRGPKVPGVKNNRSVSACVGLSKAAAPGGRTTAGSAATPTAAPGTATPRCLATTILIIAGLIGLARPLEPDLSIYPLRS